MSQKASSERPFDRVRKEWTRIGFAIPVKQGKTSRANFKEYSAIVRLDPMDPNTIQMNNSYMEYHMDLRLGTVLVPETVESLEVVTELMGDDQLYSYLLTKYRHVRNPWELKQPTH